MPAEHNCRLQYVVSLQLAEREEALKKKRKNLSLIYDSLERQSESRRKVLYAPKCCIAEDYCWIFCLCWSLGYFIVFVHVEVIKAFIGKES